MAQPDRPKTARGTRPQYFDDPSVDKLLAIVMGLAQEASVLRDRLDTHEKLAEQQIWASLAAVEGYVASDATAVERQVNRDEFVNRILRVITEELDRLGTASSGQDYDDAIEDLAT